MKRDPATVKVQYLRRWRCGLRGGQCKQGLRDEIEWHSTGQAFTVRFENSPFKYAEFAIPARGCKASGPVVDTALFVTYHYEIRKVDSGQMAADPDINVKH